MTKGEVKRGRLAWDYQIGKHNRSLNMWRGLALLACASTLVLLYYVSSYEREPKLVPYVVEVNGDQITFKGVVQPTALEANQAAVIHYLKRFITDMVSVTTDPVALKAQLRDTYAIATPQAQQLITRYIQKTDPFGAAQKGEHVDARFVWFQRQAERTWQVEWVNEEWSGGQLSAAPTMVGTFSYTTQLVQGEVEAQVNPFGLFVDWFSIAKAQTQGSSGG